MLNLPSSSFLKVTLYVFFLAFLALVSFDFMCSSPARPRGRDHLRKKAGRLGLEWEGARLRLFSLPAGLGKQERNQVGF